MKKVLIALLLCVCLLPVQVFAASADALTMAMEKPMPQKGVLTFSLSAQAADEVSEEILSMYAPYALGGNYKCSLNYEIFGEKKLKADTVTTFFYNGTENEERMWIDYDAANSKLLLIYLVNGQYSYVDMGETESGRTTLENFENMSVYNPKRIYQTMQKMSELLSNPSYKDGTYTQALAEEEYQSFLKEFSYEVVCLANGVTLYDGEAEQLRNEITEYYDVLLKDVRQLDSKEGVVFETVLDENNNIQSSACTLNIDLDSKKFAEAIEYEALHELSDAKGTVKLTTDYQTFEGAVPFPELTEENSVNLNQEEPSSPYSEGWNIVIEGERLGMKNAPYVENDRALAAGQALCYALGAEYTYENGVLTVNDGEMVFTAGSDKCLVNGEEKALDVTPKEIDYELFVPVRFLAENLGYQVGFTQELSADGESVYASIVLIDPAKMKMQLVMPESQTQQQQIAQLAATISDVELALLNSPSDSHKEWVAVTLAAGDPVVIYETTEYPLPNGASSEFFYDLKPFLEKVSPETLQWINGSEDIKKSVMDEKGAIIAFPVQCGETVERFYVPESMEHPDKVVQFLQTYSVLAKELIVK